MKCPAEAPRSKPPNTTLVSEANVTIIRQLVKELCLEQLGPRGLLPSPTCTEHLVKQR